MKNIQHLTFLHTNSLDKVKDIFKKIEIKLPDSPIFTNITPAVGTHTGPNALGFAVLQK